MADYVRNFMDLYRLAMYADKPDGATKSPVFKTRVACDTIYFNVYTNIPVDIDDGKISANFSYNNYCILMEQWDLLIKGEIDTVRMTYRAHEYVDSVRSEKPVDKSMLVIEKDSKTNMWYIAVASKNRPKIQFFFKSDNYHYLSKKDGTPYTEEEDSFAYMRGYYKLLSDIIPKIVYDNTPATFVKEDAYAEKRKKKSGYSKGGGSSPSASTKNGGYDTFDDDMPF